MKIAESWLREWVNPEFDTAELGHQLTMLGHEVDSIEAEGDGIADVIVAEVVATEKHPNADKLTLCKVDDGSGELLDVVCGAPNVTVGMKTPLARPGTTLPNGMKLRKAKIRGVESNGMLCSAIELDLGDESDGILQLPDDAPKGAALVDFLKLPDAAIDLDLTPNRGDCFSVLGIARDVAALTGDALKSPDSEVVEATAEDIQSVELIYPQGCPRFAGRLIRNIDPAAVSPIWMTERLRRSGLRAISPVVDITNFVMLELGQPLHAYDAAKLQGSIRPRLAKTGEKVTLLDDKEVELRDDTMVITDDSGVIGIAGMMGGLSTAVSDATTDVFFEAAYWPPDVMAGRARSYGMHTDASLRFERGVDPEGQARAVERASQLLLEIAGGHAGPLVDETVEECLPVRRAIDLRKDRIARLLGAVISDDIVESILGRLAMQVERIEGGWQITPPSHRFDLAIEADLIEEVARIHGYDAIPVVTEVSSAPLSTVTESTVTLEAAAATLIARDYQEVINYSFIEASADHDFSGVESELVLSNPISSEMSVMRGSLLPGLVATAAMNNARQQDRVRIFEASKTFHGTLDDHSEVRRIGGLVSGSRQPEQWGVAAENVDFFDIKADVQALLALSCQLDEIQFVAAEHTALQPGQAANIVRAGEPIGVVGKLHPSIAKKYDLKRSAFVFEMDADKTLRTTAPLAQPVSKYPAIRRDIAVVVDDEVTVDALISGVRSGAAEIVHDVRIFDIYRGEGIEAGRKSVAIGLILQETSRTLTDDDADGAMAVVIKNLKDQFGADLRD